MIGFDIGGTKCAVVTGEERNGGLIIKDKRTVLTDLGISPYEMIDKMCTLAEEMTDDFDVIGISAGGPLDSEKGVIMSPPNLIGWDEVKITEYLENKYGCRAFLENDANAGAVAEWKYGAGKGCRNMIFITFGTGCGAGLILDGRLYGGTSGMAGEIGHLRLSEYGPVGFGKKGSLEGFCSGGGLAELGRMFALEKLQAGKEVSFCKDKASLDLITAKTIAEAANRGFQDAKEVYSLCGKKLGEGLSLLIDILNPEKIVIGSIFARCEHLLKDAMNETLAKECIRQSLDVCRVVPAALGENIGDYAALAVGAIGKEKN